VALVGVTTFFPFVVAGVIVALWVTVRWIRGARNDIDELPLDHH